MTDHRGKSCEMAALTGGQVGLRALGISKFYDPHTRRELVSTGHLEVACAIGGGVAGAAVWQLAWIIYPILGLFGLFAGFIIFPVVAALVAWWLTLGAVRRRKFRRLIDEVYLSSGRCPSCEYALAGLDPENDGCVVCPECGAAWRGDRIDMEGVE